MRAPIRVDRPDILNRARPTAAAGRDWYRIVNAAEGDDPSIDTAEVWIYDEIGWDVESGPFARDLAAITAKQIRVRMNTPGGSVFDGLAIYNALLSHPAHVTVQVDGLAASAGSFIAQAGDTVIMGRNAQMMIHDAAGLCVGNATDMQAMADLLDRVSDNIAAVYTDRAGGTVEQWRDRMRDETWFSAAEAVKAGLADEMAPAPKRRGDDDEDEPGEEDMPPGEDDDEDERPAQDAAAALTRRHDLTGRYRYPGRDSAPDPDLPDVGRGSAPAPAGPTAAAAGGVVTGPFPLAADRACTYTATTTAGTGATYSLTFSGDTTALDGHVLAALGKAVVGATGAPAASVTAPEPDDSSPDVEGGESDDTDTPAPAEDPAAGDVDDAATEPEPAADTDTHAPEGVADDWTALTARIVTDPWTALTAHLTDSTSTDDLIAALRG